MKHTRWIAGLLALCLLLGSCGGPDSRPAEEPVQQTGETWGQEAGAAEETALFPQAQTGFAYRAEWSELKLGAYPERLFFLGDRLLLEASLETGERAVYDVERGSMLEAEGLGGPVLAAASDGTSLWYCVETETGLRMCAVPPEGGPASETVELGDTLYPFAVAVDGLGYFYLLGGSALHVFSAAGKLVSDFDLTEDRGVSLTRLEDGSVLMVTQSQRVKTVNTEAIGASLTGDTVSVRRVYPGWDGLGLLDDAGGLYTLNGETGTADEALDWIDTDVDPGTVITAAAENPETVYVISGDETGFRLGTLRRTPAEEDGRTVINLGVYASSELESCISALAVRYNRSQEAIRVHLVHDRSLTLDRDRLDLLVSDMQLQSPVMTDLGTLFDGEVGEDTLMPCVAAGLNRLDKVGWMPLFFCVDTLVGSKEALGQAQGWTPPEFQEAVEQHPDAMLFQMSNAYDCLDKLMQSGDYMADYAPLLEAVQHQPMDEAELSGQSTDVVEGLRSGSVLLCDICIDAFQDLLAWDAAMEGDLVLRGYPADTGNGALILMGISGGNLGIPEASAHKAEAWDFLKAVLLDESVNRYISTQGFPMLESAYAQLEREAMEGLTYVDGQGNTASTGGQVMLQAFYEPIGGPYEVEPLSQAQASEFRAYLEEATGIVYWNDGASLRFGGYRTEARNALRQLLEEKTE